MWKHPSSRCILSLLVLLAGCGDGGGAASGDDAEVAPLDLFQEIALVEEAVAEIAPVETVEEVTPPDLAVTLTPPMMTFAYQDPSSSMTKSVAIEHTGTYGTLTISEVIVVPPDQGFSATLPLTTSIEPGQIVHTKVTFAPPEGLGVRAATLSVLTDAPGDPPEVALDAMPVFPVLSASPDPVAFGLVPLDTSKDITVTITNVTEYAGTVTEVTLTGSEALWLVDGWSGTPLPVAGGDSFQLLLRYHPTAMGEDLATLEVRMAKGPTLEIAVQGLPSS